MLQKIKNIFHFLNAALAVTINGMPARKLKVIGVTGTDGKTTTSTLIYEILRAAGKKVALISTVAAFIGDEEIDTGFHVTSPEPWALQRLLKKIVNHGFEYLVLEATSHGLDQSRLLGVGINIGVLTNITHEHLDYHKTYKKYVAAKAKLFRNAEYAVLNKDDKSYVLVKENLKTMLVSYSGKDAPDYVLEKFKEDYNRQNAQAGVAVGRLLSLSESVIEVGISNFKGVKGRMEEIKNNKGLKIIVDFAHTPNALENALKSLKDSSEGKLIAVFGAAAKRDPTKRPMMGKAASELADETVLTAEDPRGEMVELINLQIKSGATRNRGHMHSIPDRLEAIDFAINKLATKGDTVGIFGKGHEQSMNMDGNVELPWSDQEAVKKVLLQ